MGSLLLDIRFALRQLARRPSFTAVLVAILALGIGATGAMFAVVRGVLIQDMPYDEPDRIVALFAPQPNIAEAPFSGPDFMDVEDGAKSFEAVGAMAGSSGSLVIGNEALEVPQQRVTGGFFEVLRVRAALGRVIEDEDADRDRKVVVISDRLYRASFGADPSILGRAVSIGGEPHEVIGVLPPGVGFGMGGRAYDLWLPLAVRAPTGNPMFHDRGSHNFLAIARLAPGVTVEGARLECKDLAARLEQAYPVTNTNVGVSVTPLKEHLVGRSRASLVLLMAAIALVLLLACVDVANLLLSRSVSRRGELAMRAALGASRGRLIRQLATESVVLGLVGGTVGLLVALWALDLFKYLLRDSVPVTVMDRVALDPGSVAVTLAVAMVSGILAGVAPALSSSRPESYESLKEGGARATAGIARNVGRTALVVVEVTIAIALLSCAGLLLKSFVSLRSVDSGFSTEHIYTASLVLPERSFDDQGSIIRYGEAVIRELSSTPGVKSAALVDRLPQGNWNTNGSVDIEGRPPSPPGEAPLVERRRATASYFSTMGIRVVDGRPFQESDTASSAPVMIVNETFAKTFFPGESAIGKRARWNTDNLPFAEIVGVYADVRTYSPEKAAPLESFIPFAQLADPGFSFVIHTDPGVDGNAILARALKTVDPLQPAYRIESMGAVVDKRVASQRSLVTLVGAFAAVAAFLAAFGIYGVVSHQTSQRTREIGVRLALGARPRDVVTMVVGQSMRPVGIGILAGLAAALACSTVVRSFLYATSELDPWVHAGVAAFVAIVGLGASVVPAVRAAAIAPASALRYE